MEASAGRESIARWGRLKPGPKRLILGPMEEGERVVCGLLRAVKIHSRHFALPRESRGIGTPPNLVKCSRNKRSSEKADVPVDELLVVLKLHERRPKQTGAQHWEADITIHWWDAREDCINLINSISPSPIVR